MMRVGLGFDAHQFGGTASLILGGITIPGPGLAGHSDGDVLAHAVTDALLGAAGLGDLGARYPNTAEWEGADSLRILEDAVAAVRDAGWTVTNVDSTVIAEAPRLSPYRTQMIEKLAGVIGIASDAVSVKATTTDAMGFTGRGEGIAALAIVAVESS